MSRKLQLIIVVFILSPILIYLVNSSGKLWSTKVLSVDEFIVWVKEGKVAEKQVVVRGNVKGGSIKFDQLKSELRFDLITEGSSNKIHVLLKSTNNLDLKDGETLEVEGIYMVEKIFIAHKVSKK